MINRDTLSGKTGLKKSVLRVYVILLSDHAKLAFETTQLSKLSDYVTSMPPIKKNLFGMEVVKE